MAAVPVPGESNLRYTGGAAAKAAEQQDKPGFLDALNRVGIALGKIIDIFSGSGGPAVRGGGFVGDPHDLAIAADATINGVPIGNYPGAVAAIHAQGLRSGATDFLYQGKPDPAHVDAVNSAAATAGASSSPIQTTDDFWGAVETALGVPHSHTSKTFLIAWANAEGTSATNNPLATTLKEPGSTTLSGNSSGVQQYATPEQGVRATADTIKKYPAIMAVLRGSASPFGNPQLNRELNIWSGKPSLGAQFSAYAKNVILGFQGNPSGSSAADWLSTVGATDALGRVVDTAKKTVTAPIAWAQGFANLLGKLTDAHTWWRVGLMLAGGVLILAGVVFLAKGAGVALPVPVP